MLALAVDRSSPDLNSSLRAATLSLVNESFYYDAAKAYIG